MLFNEGLHIKLKKNLIQYTIRTNSIMFAMEPCSKGKENNRRAPGHAGHKRTSPVNENSKELGCVTRRAWAS